MTLPNRPFKLKFDGSKDKQGKAESGYYIRDNEGKLVAAESINCGSNNILTAETRELREGVREAISLGLNDLQIEGDNICVINALKREWTTPWEISKIILDSLEDLRHCNTVQIKHCFREANMAADFLAKRGVTISSREDWGLNFPTSLSIVCSRDL